MDKEVKNKRVLQIGFGAFGEAHAEAWLNAGIAAQNLTVADKDPAALARAKARFPGISATQEWREFLAMVDCVDILTPTDSHYEIARAAIESGRDLFIEKPMTVRSAEALDLSRRAQSAGVIVQGGLYFRHHPKALALKAEIEVGRLGRLRFLSGRFAGLKRARTDSGALHNDAVHFIDLFNWLSGERPRLVFALTRDHFRRGHEDLAVLQLIYPSGCLATIETGYLQPGRWPDSVVPGAITSKEIALAAEFGVAEIDFAAETSALRLGGHRARSGVWRPEYGPATPLGAEAASPVMVLTRQFRQFLLAQAQRLAPDADLIACGYVPARIIEAAIESAASEQAVALDWTDC